MDDVKGYSETSIYSFLLKNWDTFSSLCPYMIPDQYGNPQCTFYEGSIGECKITNCPFFLGFEDYPLKEEEKKEEWDNCLCWNMVGVEA